MAMCLLRSRGEKKNKTLPQYCFRSLESTCKQPAQTVIHQQLTNAPKEEKNIGYVSIYLCGSMDTFIYPSILRVVEHLKKMFISLLPNVLRVEFALDTKQMKVLK